MSDPLDILTSATAYLQNHQIKSHGMDAPDHDPPRQRKRRRVALSCEQCRQRKVKCDRNEPCGACIIARISGCVYKDNNPGGATQAGGDTPSLSRSLQPIVPDPSNRAAGFPPSPAITQSPPGKSVASSLGQREPNKRTTGASNPYSENLGDLDSKPLKGVRGTFAKNRLYGESHWTSYLTTSSIAIEGIRDIAKEGFSDAFGQLGKCKALAREVKAQETPDEDKLRQNDWLLPSRTVADMLVDAYLRSIETLMQILDVQQFKTLYEQYWKDSESVPRGFGFSMLLIFANGAAVCADHGISRKNVIHWLYSASQWLGSPKAKMRTNLWSLRTHCLLLLARQLNGIDGKLTALSAGSLVATAMHMGLHVDPSHFAASQVPAEEQETRRRLWATVLELELESTMDSGGRPLLREDDYDCAPPSNIDDREKNTASCRNKILPMERFTQSSVQILLARSVPIRLKVVRFVNDFRPGARYEDALALSKELVEEMRRGSELIDVWRKASAPIAQFQIELYNIIMYRFLLALHYSYALKAKDEPLFYYSRKICLDASLAVLSPPVMQRDGDFYRLALHGRSVVQDVYTAAANFLCEYICAESANSAFLLPATGPSPNDNLIAALEAHVPLNLARIEIAETNVKSHLLLQCLIAFAKANRSGANIQENLRTAINLSLQDAHAALRSRLEGSSPASVEAQNMPAGEDMSLENLFNWLQGDDVFGSSDGDAWMNGLDWYIPNDGTMMDAVTAGASGMSD